MKKLLSLSAMLLAVLLLITSCAGAAEYSTDDCTETTDTFNPADGNWTCYQEGKGISQGKTVDQKIVSKLTISNNRMTATSITHEMKFKTVDLLGGQSSLDALNAYNNLIPGYKEAVYNSTCEQLKVGFENSGYTVNSCSMDDNFLTIKITYPSSQLAQNDSIPVIPSTIEIKTNEARTKFTYTKSVSYTSSISYSTRYIWIKD